MDSEYNRIEHLSESQLEAEYQNCKNTIKPHIRVVEEYFKRQIKDQLALAQSANDFYKLKNQFDYLSTLTNLIEE